MTPYLAVVRAEFAFGARDHAGAELSSDVRGIQSGIFESG